MDSERYRKDKARQAVAKYLVETAEMAEEHGRVRAGNVIRGVATNFRLQHQPKTSSRVHKKTSVTPGLDISHDDFELLR